MREQQSAPWIVVGIDGSKAATNAAKWAIVEANSRDLPLRLVHVIEDGAGSASATDPDIGVEYAETVLREADAALQADGKPVKVESVLVRGIAERALIDESRHAAMVCVGSVGISRCSSKLLGSTAASLASAAHCPVAIIRNPCSATVLAGGWIAVAVDDAPGNDALLEHAFREASLRAAPILALQVHPWQRGRLLDCLLDRWASRYPDVPVRVTPVQRGITEFLAETDESVQLAVIGEAESDSLIRIVGPIRRAAADHTGCSVLVVRD